MISPLTKHGVQERGKLEVTCVALTSLSALHKREKPTSIKRQMADVFKRGVHQDKTPSTSATLTVASQITESKLPHNYMLKVRQLLPCSLSMVTAV